MTIVDLDIAPRLTVRPRRVVPSRSVALFVVGLLTLLTVTGSARATPHLVRALWSAPYDRDDDTLTLSPTALYLFHHDAGAPKLKAYDLATGRLRWSVPSTDIVAQPATVADGVIVLPDGFERYFNRPDLILSRTTRTIARDTRTGAALWRAAGAPADVTGSSVLLVDTEPGDVAEVRDVSLHDGHTLWSRPVPNLSNVAVLGDSVVTAATDGQLAVLRYSDGTISRTEKVPWPDNGWLSVVAGRVVVSNLGPGDHQSTVYRPDTLAQLWQADGTLTDCGAVLCGTDLSGLIGYDPDTGTQRWRMADMTIAWPVGPARVIAASELNGQYQLIDPATGHPVGAAGTGLGTWRDDGRSAVNGEPTPPYAYVLRGVPNSPGQTAVVRLNTHTGEQSVLGAVDGSGWIGCRNITKYLVCLQDARLTVTTID